MIGFYARTLEIAVLQPAWILRRWLTRSPITFYIALAFTTSCLTLFLFPQSASAVTVDSPVVAAGMTDSYGVPLGNYGVLPIDVGGPLDIPLAVVSLFSNMLWMVHVAVVSWMLWLVDWLLDFAWVDVLAAPFVGLADLFQSFLGRVEWLPFALAVTGAVAGAAIILGRVGSGIAEVLISVMCATVAVTTLANPVQAITAAGGALDQVQDVGGSLSGMVVQRDIDTREQTDVLSDSISGELATLFIRIPAQTVAFGQALPESCDATFTQLMQDKPPQIDANAVKDEIRGGSCFTDPETAAFVKMVSEHLTFAAPVSLLFIMTGSVAMFAIPLVLSVLLFAAVLGSLFAALRLMFHIYAAILPINRSGLWKAMSDTFIGLVSIAVMCVTLAAVVTVMVDAVRGFTTLGIGIVPQSLITTILVSVLVFVLVRARRGTMRIGEAMAAFASRWGLNGGYNAPQKNPLVSMAGAAATAMVGKRVFDSMKSPSRPVAPVTKGDDKKDDEKKTSPTTAVATRESVPTGGRPNGRGSRPQSGTPGGGRPMGGGGSGPHPGTPGSGTGREEPVELFVVREPTPTPPPTPQQRALEQRTVRARSNDGTVHVSPAGRAIRVDMGGVATVGGSSAHEPVVQDISSLPPFTPRRGSSAAARRVRAELVLHPSGG